MGVGDGMDVTGTSPGWWCVRSSQSRVERGLDTNRNDKGKGRRKTGFPSVGASLPGVGWVTHLGLAASAPQPEVSTARSQESGTLGGLSPAFPSHLLSPHPSALPSSAEKELEAWGGEGCRQQLWQDQEYNGSGARPAPAHSAGDGTLTHASHTP